MMKEDVNFSEIWHFVNVCLWNLWRQTHSLCLCFICSLLPVPGEQSALTLCSDGDVVPCSVSVMMKCGWAHSACSSRRYASFCSPSGNAVIRGCVRVWEMASHRAAGIQALVGQRCHMEKLLDMYMAMASDQLAALRFAISPVGHMGPEPELKVMYFLPSLMGKEEDFRLLTSRCKTWYGNVRSQCFRQQQICWGQIVLPSSLFV